MSPFSFLFEDRCTKPSTSGKSYCYQGIPIEEVAASIITALSQLRDDQSKYSKLNKTQQDLIIHQDTHKFEASIDVHHFQPEEISVKLSEDYTVIVEAKHEEKQDEHGFISRRFVRKFVLPGDCDNLGLQSKLSSDGVLTISAPKKKEAQGEEGWEIPVVRIGQMEADKIGREEQQENKE